MPSLYDTRELPELRAEFASLYTEFRGRLYWPDPSGGWYVLERGCWFRQIDEMDVFKADSGAGVREWLRGFEQDAHAWQAARLADGVPAGDPPVPDRPWGALSAPDVAALTATMHQAATGLAPPDPPMAELLPGLSVPGWLSDLPWSMLTELSGRLAGGRSWHRWRPGGSRAGRAHRERV